MSELTIPSAAPDAAGDTPLDGYVLPGMNDGYTAQLGNLYWHAGKRAVAVRIGPHRLNHPGIPHGGMLATLADSAIGYVLNRQA